MSNLFNDNAFLIAFWAAICLLFISIGLLITCRRLRKKNASLTMQGNALRLRAAGGDIKRHELEEELISARQRECRNYAAMKDEQKRADNLAYALQSENYRNLLLAKILLRVYPYFRFIQDNPEKIEVEAQKGGRRKSRRKAA